MGGGTWSAATYDAVTTSRIASGTSFAYDRTAKATGNYAAHESVDPKRLNAAGLNVRESRDSVEHPNSKAMVIGFDQTGSMGSIPGEMQKRLKTVFKLTTDKGVEDVQIAVAAYGDAANGEYVPLQISQFESDNRIDEALDKLFLEGNGGGNGGETSNLLFYYLAYHTELDSLDKRGEKGKVYLIADERQVAIDAAIVEKYIGDGQPLGDLGFEAIAAAVTEKYDVTILLINNSSAKWQRSEEFYSGLFGPDNVVIVQDTKAIPEMIAGLFAYDMGRDLDDIKADLTASAGKEIAVRVADTIAKRGAKKSVGLR